MNILVTGGAGFIGSHMAKRHLADGHRVVIVDDLSSGRRERLPEAARFVQADIADGRTSSPSCARRRSSSSRTTPRRSTCATASPIPSATRAPTSSAASCSSRRCAGPASRHVLFSSTGGAIYGEPEGGRPAPESHPTNPISPYGCAKLSIEKYMHYYRVVHGFQTQVFRYANVYGPWQDGTGEAGVVAIFSEAMLGSRPLKINGDGEQTRDYVYVGDLVEAAAAAASEATRAASGTSAPASRPPSTASSRCSRRSTATRRHPRTSRRRRASRCAASSTARSCGGTSACRAWTRLEDGLKADGGVLPEPPQGLTRESSRERLPYAGTFGTG